MLTNKFLEECPIYLHLKDQSGFSENVGDLKTNVLKQVNPRNVKLFLYFNYDEPLDFVCKVDDLVEYMNFLECYDYPKDEYYLMVLKNSRFLVLIPNQLMNEIKQLILSGTGRLFVSLCKFGYLKMVKKMYNSNSKYMNNLALCCSATRGHLDIVRFLIEKGADVHTNNDAALRWSARNGHLDVVRYLVGKGANVHARNNWALKSSTQNGHLDVIKYLIEKGM